jgi:hypothetical protein
MPVDNDAESSMSLEATELRDYMSGLSQKAWNAGWMSDLEYALWDAVEHGPRSYGRLNITEQHIAKLHELSLACGGWIQFGENSQAEEFVPLGKWHRFVGARSDGSSPPAV